MLQGEPRVHGRCSEGTVDWRAGRLAGGSKGEVVRECHGERSPSCGLETVALSPPAEGTYQGSVPQRAFSGVSEVGR